MADLKQKLFQEAGNGISVSSPSTWQLKAAGNVS